MSQIIGAVLVIIAVMVGLVVAMILLGSYCEAHAKRKVLKKTFLEVMGQLSDEQRRRIHLPDYGTVFAFLTIAEDVPEEVWLKMFTAVFDQLTSTQLRELNITYFGEDEYQTWSVVEALLFKAVSEKEAL